MFTYPTTSHYNRDDIRLRNWYISEVVRCCSDLHRFLLRLLAMGPQKKTVIANYASSSMHWSPSQALQ